MIEEIAVVTNVDAQQVIVKSEIKSACSGCKQVDSCASGQIAKAIPHKKLTVTLENTLSLDVGDKVVIGIVEKELLATAMQVYMWPLVGLIAFSALGQLLITNGVFTHELMALSLGIVGGVFGFFFAKKQLTAQNQQKNLTPTLLRKACQIEKLT